MARSMPAEAEEVFRAVITTTYPADHRVWPGRSFTSVRGPYSHVRPASAAITTERRQWRYHPSPPEVTGRVERASLKWESVD